jgi:MFS family permease
MRTVTSPETIGKAIQATQTCYTAQTAGASDRLKLADVALVAMLAVISLFEGFDIALTSVVMPYAGATFHASAAAIGQALAVTGLGAIAAWPLVRLADRFGRRPVLLAGAAGFALTSLATVPAADLRVYAVVQLVARSLMVTQVALAYLVVAETLPARLRGRINGALGACGSLGAGLPFLLIGPALKSALGWRALFLVGGAPLLVLPFLLVWLKETPAFLRADAATAHSRSVWAELKALTAPPLRGRFVAMAALWFVVLFASTASSAFFTLYVVRERHWAPGDLGRLAPFIMAGALFGSALAGVVMDLVGRRAAVAGFLVLMGALDLVCYLWAAHPAIAAAWVGVQLAMGVWTAAYTLNFELFPTHLRAAANGWCNNLIGRWGVVIAPAALGALSGRLGSIGHACALASLVAFAGAPIAWFGLPETRSRRWGTSP